MTKMKSKKMTKSTFAVIIMAIAMIALLAFGGTYAYFTATTDAVTAGVSTGKVTLTTGSKLVLVKGPVVPGQELLTVAEDAEEGAEAGIVYKSGSTVANYVFVTFSVKIYESNAEGAEEVDLGDDVTVDDILAYSAELGTNGWTQLKTDADGETSATDVAGVYFILLDGTTGKAFDAELSVVSQITFQAGNNYHEGKFDADNSSTGVDLEGKYIEVSVSAKSVQQYGLDTPYAAYSVATGSIEA